MKWLARRVINFLVERYFPNGLFFYGNGPLRAFEEMDDRKGKGIGSMAAIYLARVVAKNGATEIKIEADDVTVNDEELGDWIVTVRRAN